MNPVDFAELARMAASRVPCIGPVWRVDALALVLDGGPDRAAWVQLGVTLEAIAITAAARGVATTIESLVAPRVKLAIGSCTIAPNVQRLAACLDRQNQPFQTTPARLAAHVQARLGGAAAAHECTLAWREVVDRGSIEPELPEGVCAVAIVNVASEDRAALVRGGRASCRVWLEAASLGLAVLPATASAPAVSINWLGMAA